MAAKGTVLGGCMLGKDRCCNRSTQYSPEWSTMVCARWSHTITYSDWAFRNTHTKHNGCELLLWLYYDYHYDYITIDIGGTTSIIIDIWLTKREIHTKWRDEKTSARRIKRQQKVVININEKEKKKKCFYFFCELMMNSN